MRVAALSLLGCLVVGCGASEGDACSGSEGVCTSSTAALACAGGVVRRLECRGAGGCQPRGDGVLCDQSLAEEGDACRGGVACTVDHRALLACEEGRFARGADCPTGCELSDDRATCVHPELRPLE